jgi:hypothetical protein
MIEEMKNLSRAQPAVFPLLVQAPTQFADIDVTVLRLPRLDLLQLAGTPMINLFLTCRFYGAFNNDGVFDRRRTTS